MKTIKERIKALVKLALSNSNEYKEEIIGTVTATQAKKITSIVPEDVLHCPYVLSNHTIRHILNNHGSEKDEAKRGQVAVTLDEFELIPNVIANPEEIIYEGKNRRKQDSFLYKKRIGSLYIIIQSIRVKKRGNIIEVTTMYKHK